MRLEYTYKGTQRNLVINLQFSGQLQCNVPHTKHRSKSEAILPEEGMSDHGKVVLSEGNDHMLMIRAQHTMP